MADGINTVIFDMDGVIFDSEILVLSSWKEVAGRHGIQDVEKVCHECLGTNSAVSKQIFLRHYGQDFPYDEYKAEMAEVFFAHASDGKLAKKQGVEELLKYLKDKGFKVGIASSTREKIVRRQISDMVKHSKPEPDIFLEACGRLESKPENCYVIEDSYNGIRAAHAAGMHPIMVPDLMEPTEEMKSLAEQILGSLCAVQEFLQESVR